MAKQKWEGPTKSWTDTVATCRDACTAAIISQGMGRQQSVVSQEAGILFNPTKGE